MCVSNVPLTLFCSPDKLIVTAPARNAPTTGAVVVETVSGGQSESSVEFSYVEPGVEHAERRATDGAFGLSHLLPRKQKPMGRVPVCGLNGLICHPCLSWFRGVTVSTSDSESDNPSSNLGGTFFLFLVFVSFFFFLTSFSYYYRGP